MTQIAVAGTAWGVMACAHAAGRLLADGEAVGLFVEGTRQRSGMPGEVKSGASMAALQEGVPVVVGAIHGSQTWKVGNFHPVSVAWSEPMRFAELPRGARGYREASAEIERELHRLWAWLRDLHRAGRPRDAVPPRLPESRRAPVTLP
jgi:1-acyl-sn-glycerol-3-phosphate acyltransferase